jgi:hypothetical protein
LRLFGSLLLFAAGLLTSGYAAYGETRLNSVSDIPSAISDLGAHWFQVRIEQRVIIRVPRQRSSQASNITVGNARTNAVKYREQKIGKCVMMDRLVGSRPGPDDSLELVTRDGALIRAYLGNGCLAREFYAGAYMERPGDGKLCVKRDMLYARTGARCEIDKLRLLQAQ